MLKFLRNAWYASAFSSEVADKPFARKIVDRNVVLFRSEAGIVALEDRCPHRFAPLSMGVLVEDSIQCPYHGLRFSGEGHCVHNPHGGNLPTAARVTSFPALEKYGIIWIWPGDPEQAAEEKLPVIDFLEQTDRFKTVEGRLHVKGNYELIVDNLLDLSHSIYLHPQFTDSAIPTDKIISAISQKLERYDRSLVNHRYRTGLPAPAPAQKMFGFDGVTPTVTKTTMAWHAPAMLDFDVGTWYVDTPEHYGALMPALHVITPETEFTSHYFFISGRNRRLDDPEMDKAMLGVLDFAFHGQDEPMIEAIQERMGQTSDLNALNPVLLQTDAAPVSARRILARLIEQENAQLAAAAE